MSVHEKIRQWRLHESLKKPTSADRICLNIINRQQEEKMLAEIKKTKNKGENLCR